jgi:hypothetical protein
MTVEVAGRPNEADRNASERQFLAQKRNLSYHLLMTSFPNSTIVRVRKSGRGAIARIPQPGGARKLEKILFESTVTH